MKFISLLSRLVLLANVSAVDYDCICPVDIPTEEECYKYYMTQDQPY